MEFQLEVLKMNNIDQERKPVSTKLVTRILVIMVVILSLIAGFYHSSYESEKKKYLRLEDKYVRVRSELGREETQKLIDQSYDN